jgi:Holliday junction DNA helicase RuvA
MIGYVAGQILEHADGRMIVVVGASDSGVGYSVQVPHSPDYGRFLPGGRVVLYVHTHVREDQLDLFGFASSEEKELFLTLLSVNGVGPKGALGILSGAEASQLLAAVMEGDTVFLQRLPGVGKKTAERLVLELGDVFRKKLAAGLLGALKPSAGSASASGRALSAAVQQVAAASNERRELVEARQALLGLGFREPEVTPVLRELLEKAGAAPQVEKLIVAALQRLG